MRTIDAGLAQAGEVDDRAVAHAPRHVDLESSGAMDPAASPATRTYLIVLRPFAAAVGANLVDLQRELAYHTAESFDPQGERRYIEQHHVFDFSGKDTRLNGCPNGNDFIGVDRLVGFFAGNETPYQGLHRRRAGGSALFPRRLPKFNNPLFIFRGDHMSVQSGSCIWSILIRNASCPVLRCIGEAFPKFAVGRTRPAGESHSFPSGHASTSFMIATIAERYYGKMAGIIGYSAATFIAFARARGNKHRASDLTAGATLGYIVGSSVCRRTEISMKAGKIVLLPAPDLRNRRIRISLIAEPE